MNICYNGDSFKLLRKTENETINLILTDIPYNISRDNNFSSMGRQGFDWIWDSYTGVFKLEHLSCLCPLVKKTGSILVFSSFQQCGDLDEIMQKAGMVAKDKIIWNKKNPMPRNTNRRYVSDKELINWYVKKNGKWTFNKKENESYLRSILNFPISTHLSKFHPTAKNVDLLAALIKIHSDPNDIVLDAFAGSFTTGLAAAKTGRQFVLCEIDEKFYENGKMLLTKNNIEFTDGEKR